MSVKVIDSFRRIVITEGASTNGQVVADADNDTLTLDAGAGINLYVDENTDKIILEVESAAEFLANAVGTFEVFADDSTVRTVGANEQIGFLGAGTVSTSTDAEGAVTITGDDDLSNFDNSTSGFISDITSESIGDLSDVALSSIGDGEILQWSSGSFINRTLSEAGFAGVATSGAYGDLTSRPNLTFDGDVSGNTGGALGGGASTITLTLDNVNSNIGTFNTVTVNAKGLVTSASNVTFATVATTGSYNDLTDLPSLAGTYKFNIAADDSTVEPINSQETVQIVGGTNITTSLNDGVITVTGPANLSDLNNDLTVSQFANDAGYITVDEVPQTFSFSVGADDSTLRNISAGESFKIIGGTAITTSSDAEGNITITGVAQDFSWSSITGTPTTLSGYGITDAATSAQGALADSAVQPGDNISNLVNDAGYITTYDQYKFSIAADDSTLREVGNDETVKFIGSQNVTTSSDAEGNITIAGPDLSSYVQQGDTFVGDVKGSVVADDSTVLIDGVAGKIVGPIEVSSLKADTILNLTTTLNLATLSDNIVIDSGASSTITLRPGAGGISIGSSNGVNINNTGAGTINIGHSSNQTNFAGTVDFTNATITNAGFTTETYVDNAIANLIDSAPGALDTLNELAAAINDDANFAATVTNRFTAIENNVFAIGADDSTMRTVKQGEGIKIIGGTNLTTSSDAEGNITVDFVNPGYITDGLQTGDNISDLVNNVGYLAPNDYLFSVAGDDSTLKNINQGESIKFIGGTDMNVTTDAEGHVTVTFANDTGYITENDTITLFGDVTGSGKTSINVTLADSPIAAGTYNRVTFDTKGIAQSGQLIDYLQDGDGISRLNNDVGYLTAESAINFNISGDDSTGFNVVGGNTIQFTGTGGIVVSATSSPSEIVTIDGSGLVEVGDNVSTLINDAGYYSAGSHMIGDLQGSIFADDSTKILDGETGTLYGRLVGDVNGSVVADDSTVLIDGPAGKIVGPIQGSTASFTGAVGLGTTTPTVNDYGIEIYNEGNDTNSGIRLSACNNTGVPGQKHNSEILYNGASGFLQILHYGSGDSNGSERLRIDSGGDTYTNDGTVSSLSDSRVKKEIVDLADGLDLINQLRPVTFKYNGLASMAPDDGEVRYGFIADEVQSVAPQYVKETQQEVNGETVDDFKILSTGRMIPMLVKALQEATDRIASLEAEVAQLKGE